MAVFVPSPEREAVQELIEELSVHLAQRYRDAEDTLIREVAKQAVRDFQLAAMLPTATGGMGTTAAERRHWNRINAELKAPCRRDSGTAGEGDADRLRHQRGGARAAAGRDRGIRG